MGRSGAVPCLLDYRGERVRRYLVHKARDRYWTLIWVDARRRALTLNGARLSDSAVVHSECSDEQIQGVGDRLVTFPGGMLIDHRGARA